MFRGFDVTTAEVLFRCERSGHFQVRCSHDSGSCTVHAHSIKNSWDNLPVNAFVIVELEGEVCIFHRFPAIHAFLK